jgi:tetratricopeptide (TPR) repeat protein
LASDRDATLKKAEKLLRQGRHDLAIAEYVRVVEENPGDWSTANTLGELYARAGQTAEAIEQYSRIAGHFVDEGFYPKAAALFKKILKLSPQDESTQIRLAEISAKQGLLADAKSYLNAIAARRRAKGDRRGTAEIVVRLGSIDPADFDARLLAARTAEEMGEEEDASARFKALHDDLRDKGRIPEALDALKEFVRINPLEREARSTLARAALKAGDIDGAREFLDEHSAGDDPDLLFPLVEIELRSGDLGRARQLMDRLLAAAPARRADVYEIAWTYVDSSSETAFVCIDAGVSAAVAAADFEDASGKLREFVSRVPGQIPALLKLVEVCVDGGLESAMYEAQEQLTDAYLAANQAAEARLIAEDLVAREPWEPAHIDRFRKALVMLRVSDPDTLIAERLSGQAPFMARDPFFQAPEPPTEPQPEPVPSASAPEDSDVPAEITISPESEAGSETRIPLSRYDEAALDDDQPETAASVSQPSRKKQRPAGGDEIDLTGALGNLNGHARETAEPAEKLDEVFSDLREQASEDSDFSAQHMTLARTYLEMGMLDEAQSALETAVRSPRQRFEAAAALGRLHDRRGDQTLAIEWLERAAGAQPPNADEGRALLYDLGLLLEGIGETSRALAVFLELQAEAGDYRDVPARIDRLARVQTGG